MHKTCGRHVQKQRHKQQSPRSTCPGLLTGSGTAAGRRCDPVFAGRERRGDSYNYTGAPLAGWHLDGEFPAIFQGRVRARLAAFYLLHHLSGHRVSSSLFGLIPAAGSGTRLGAETPKQYLPLEGPDGARPMLLFSIAALLAVPDVELVFVVLTPGDERFREFDLSPYGGRVAPLYCGGASRRDSVLNGLIAAANVADPDDWMLVHDAARPCLAAADLERLIVEVRDGEPAAGDADGGILAVRVADTLKRAADDAGGARIAGTEPRDGLWQAQTPQMFRYAPLLDALRKAPDATDEASAIERTGARPRLVEGSSRNIKVTFEPDLELAGMILRAQAGGQSR
jgi:2-C-methyl-D-erythritol 4-phosphate cytidylyltransferase